MENESKVISTIQFNYDYVDYTLEYNRTSVKAMEMNGFSIVKLSDFSYTQLELLFKGAFIMHHPTISEDRIMEIFDHMGNKEELWATLVAMVQTTYTSLVDEPAEKNIKWEAKK